MGTTLKNQKNLKKIPRSEFMKALRGYVGKTKYGKGCFGQRLTRQLLVSKRDNPRLKDWYNAKSKVDSTKTNYEYLLQFCDGKWFIADCCGLIKGIRAGYRADGTVGRMTQEIDQTIKEMVESLEDVHTDYAKAQVGEMVFFKDYSHVMTVSKYGEKDIESAPSLDGVKEVSLFYQPKSRVGGAGKLPWIDYEEVIPAPVKEDEVKYSELQVCRNGSKGDAVRTIQANVRVTVDGIFGNGTEKAVKTFQKEHGLTADGIVGEKTWKAIIERWSK